MASDDFAQAVERAQQLSNALKDKAKLILRKALPHIEALQRDNSHLSPRLMSLMVSRAEGKMPESDRATLGSVIQYLEEFDQPLFVWLMALKDGTHSLDVAAESAKCREAIKALERSSGEFDNIPG